MPAGREQYEGHETTAAAIDIGSNTIHLTVARVRPDGRMTPVSDSTQLVRLGADVTANGVIGVERAERAVKTLRRQVAQARAAGAEAILGVATEGVRAATNGAAFLAQVREQTGLAFTLVDGEQEAALTYWGAVLATGHPADAANAPAAAGRRGVIDLGGGSIELVVGEGARIAWRVSLPLGSGLIHDRYAPSDPPSLAELTRAEAFVAERLAEVAPPLPVRSVAVSGGTAKALLRVATLLKGVSGPSTLNEQDFAAVIDALVSEPAEAAAARFGLDPERVRILAAGGVVLREAMRRLNTAELAVRWQGIREGALWAWAHAGDAWAEYAARGGER